LPLRPQGAEGTEPDASWGFTPLRLAIRNRTYHFGQAIDAIDQVPRFCGRGSQSLQLSPRALYAKQAICDTLMEHKQDLDQL
jgi:hypothetical protein